MMVLEEEEYSPSEEKSDPNLKALQRIGTVFGGVYDDYKRRYKYRTSDYTDGFTWKTVSASLYMFFATFASTVALGVVIQRNTQSYYSYPPGVEGCEILKDGTIDDKTCHPSYFGVTEFLLMNCLAGMIHSVIGCQPLLVLRPTGPITQFITLLYTLTQSLFPRYEEVMPLPGSYVAQWNTTCADHTEMFCCPGSLVFR